MSLVFDNREKRNLPRSVLPGTKCQAGHLSSNTNTALVQDLNGILVTLALLTKKVALGNDDVVKVQHASAAGPDTELVLLLGDRETGSVPLNYECGDTPVPLAGVKVGEDEVKTRLLSVGDPHFGAVESVAVGNLLSLGLQSKRVRAGRRLGQTEGADGAGAQLGQPGAVGLGIAVFHDGGVDQGIVDINHDTDTRVDASQLLDRDNGRGEVHAGSAELLGNLDAHDTLLEELLHHGWVHGLGFVHIADLRADLLLGEL